MVVCSSKRAEKSWNFKIWQILQKKLVTVQSILGIYHHFRKSGYGRCSKCSKTCKNSRKFKIQKNFENIILELPFGVGFIRIHQLTRFLQQFEIWWFPDFGVNFPNFIKDLYWILGQNPENRKSGVTFDILTFDLHFQF